MYFFYSVSKDKRVHNIHKLPERELIHFLKHIQTHPLPQYFHSYTWIQHVAEKTVRSENQPQPKLTPSSKINIYYYDSTFTNQDTILWIVSKGYL